MIEQTLRVHVCFNYPLMHPNELPAEITVVAAVLEHTGRILIAQRKRGSRHALKWEFPGGKVEAGESPRAALARELREELDIQAAIGEQLAAYDVRYPGGPLTHLLFYRVTEFTGEPRNLEFEQIVWESRGHLAEYDFLEGDVAFLRLLATTKTATARLEE
jgi:8-oxo-dGTP diphosphatase